MHAAGGSFLRPLLLSLHFSCHCQFHYESIGSVCLDGVLPMDEFFAIVLQVRDGLRSPPLLPAYLLTNEHDLLAIEFIFALAERHSRLARIDPNAGELAALRLEANETKSRGLAGIGYERELRLEKPAAMNHRLSAGAGGTHGFTLAWMKGLHHVPVASELLQELLPAPGFDLGSNDWSGSFLSSFLSCDWIGPASSPAERGTATRASTDRDIAGPRKLGCRECTFSAAASHRRMGTEFAFSLSTPFPGVPVIRGSGPMAPRTIRQRVRIVTKNDLLALLNEDFGARMPLDLRARGLCRAVLRFESRVGSGHRGGGPARLCMVLELCQLIYDYGGTVEKPGDELNFVLNADRVADPRWTEETIHRLRQRIGQLLRHRRARLCQAPPSNNHWQRRAS